MYKIVNFETGALIEKKEDPMWMKMQSNGVEIICYECNADTADGVRLSDGTILGIEGRNMQNYTPTVLVEKMSDEAVKLEELSAKVEAMDGKVNAIYDAQTQDVVSKADLDAAYREGVNAVV